MTESVESAPRVLIIEDDEHVRMLLKPALERAGCAVVTAADGRDGLRVFDPFQPDLVLLDLGMPAMDGLEICRRMRASGQRANVPVLMITGKADMNTAELAFEAGATDVLAKPIVLPVLEQRVLRLIGAYRDEIKLRELGDELRRSRDELEARVQQRTEELRRANERLTVELAHRKRIQEQLAHDVFHDDLTGLANRTLFTARLAHAISRSRRRNAATCATLFMDLDRFKTINDSLGHLVGDELLIEVARRIKHALRPGDTVARFGGDEFAILVEGVSDRDHVRLVAERILSALAEPFALQGHTVVTSASIGIAFLTETYATPAEVLRDADIAMYEAKSQGKARYVVFDPLMHALALAHIQLEDDLRDSIERQEFVLHYQPIVDLSGGAMIGVEALIRWQHRDAGLVHPVEFIAVAEESGLIVPIGDWVLRTACAQLSAWRDDGLSDLFVSINLSARQFHNPLLVATVRAALEESGLSPRQLHLEITESSLSHDIESTLAALDALKALGVDLSIDDFGIGYSSLNYLQRFPLTALKIDRSFLSNIKHNPGDAEIVTAIIAMAHRLNLKVVAEGVEFDDQVSFLRRYDCDAVQGYLYCPPVPPDVLARRIATRRASLEVAHQRQLPVEPRSG